MLSKAEVQAIIDAAQELKTAKGGKGGASAANQNIADQRVRTRLWLKFYRKLQSLS